MWIALVTALGPLLWSFGRDTRRRWERSAGEGTTKVIKGVDTLAAER